MSSGHNGRSGIKYSEILTMGKMDPCRNGNGNYSPGEQDQNCNVDPMYQDTMYPLKTKVFMSDSGIATTEAMEHQSKEQIYYDVDVKNTKYRARFLMMAAFAGLMTVIVIVLAVLLGVGVGAPTTDSDMCTSQDCVTAASRILNTMDTSVDPCEDFFTFSCGKWNREHVIPEDKSSVSTFNDVRDSVSLTLKEVLEKDSTGDRESIAKAKTLYASCLDTDKMNNLGGQPALDMITKLGGMPLFGDTLDSATWSMEDALGKSIAEFGSYSVVSMWVGSDDKDSSANIIHVDQPSLGMPNRDYYLEEVKRNATLPGYRQFMNDYLSLLWSIKDSTMYDETQVSATAETMIQLETEIAEIMTPPEDRRDSFAIYRKRTIQEMDDVNADFDWLTYINTALDYVDKTVEASRKIVSYGDPYFQNFTRILSSYSNEDIQNYIVWMVLRGRVSYLGKEYRDTQAPYRLAVSGTSTERARWQTCTDNANGNFPMPVGALFVEAKFPEKNKEVTEVMVENIRTSFIGFLPGNDWMDSTTKTAAEEKANMIKPIIAYPDYILEEENSKMDDDYADASVNADAFFENMQSLTLFSTKENFNKLDTPVDRDEWITGPAVVNAFYSPTRNQIVFPAGILQPPFYDQGQPNSMNYGGIGMVIGHEITHGFDDSGSQFNGIGNLEDWWTNSSRTNFNTKAKCMEDQYTGYYWDDAKSNLNGKLTLGENIADNGGIREAFDAYQTWKKDNDADLNLPGLENYSQEQLFFLSMAQVWCGTYRPEYATRLVATDPHSPGIYRVIGSLSNFDEFGKAYGCKQGTDEMYPKEEDTCRVW